MHSENAPGPDSTEIVRATELKSLARRRLIRGGLGAAPVILTFVSRPAPADVIPAGSCLSASATFSLAAGEHSNGVHIAGGTAGCTGRGPASWAAAPFPPSYTPSSLFSDNFPGYTSGKTLMNILTAPDLVVGDPQSQLRRNLVAALLNLDAGLLSPSLYSIATLVTIWNGLKTGGPGSWPVKPPSTWNITQTNAWFGTLFVGAS